jgi:hypothetical protein
VTLATKTTRASPSIGRGLAKKILSCRVVPMVNLFSR